METHTRSKRSPFKINFHNSDFKCVVIATTKKREPEKHVNEWLVSEAGGEGGRGVGGRGVGD